jgi:hypothetical protein
VFNKGEEDTSGFMKERRRRGCQPIGTTAVSRTTASLISYLHSTHTELSARIAYSPSRLARVRTQSIGVRRRTVPSPSSSLLPSHDAATKP